MLTTKDSAKNNKQSIAISIRSLKYSRSILAQIFCPLKNQKHQRQKTNNIFSTESKTDKEENLMERKFADPIRSSRPGRSSPGRECKTNDDELAELHQPNYGNEESKQRKRWKRR